MLIGVKKGDGAKMRHLGWKIAFGLSWFFAIPLCYGFAQGGDSVYGCIPFAVVLGIVLAILGQKAFGR